MCYTCINCNEKYKVPTDKCKICGYPVEQEASEKLVHISLPEQKDGVRQYILNRITEIKQDENGFSNKARYGEFSTGSVKVDASKIKWEDLNDYDLVFLFERLVRRYNAQM
jgi:hypothetical protein